MVGQRDSASSGASLNPEIAEHGISLLTASIFIVGEIAGAGLLAMPAALKSTGWYLGTILLVVVGAGSAVCGVLLSECWNHIERGDESLAKTKTRNPYSVIGYQAYGRWGSNVTIISLILTLFGGQFIYECIRCLCLLRPTFELRFL